MVYASVVADYTMHRLKWTPLCSVELIMDMLGTPLSEVIAKSTEEQGNRVVHYALQVLLAVLSGPAGTMCIKR